MQDADKDKEALFNAAYNVTENISSKLFCNINELFCDIQESLSLCARLIICALWSPAGKGLTSWLSFVVTNCEFVTFPLVSWVRCGT